jgi:carbonic anhydrase/acetyltransferase-like protein (isoleucine patch superfamily)
MNLFDKAPALGREVFIAPSAAVIGSVKLGDKSSVFYGSVLKGGSQPLPACPPACPSLQFGSSQ